MFQSAPPHGGRHESCSRHGRPWVVSIRAPARGATDYHRQALAAWDPSRGGESGASGRLPRRVHVPLQPPSVPAPRQALLSSRAASRDPRAGPLRATDSAWPASMRHHNILGLPERCGYPVSRYIPDRFFVRPHAGPAGSATQSHRCSHSGIVQGQAGGFPGISGDFCGHGRSAGETRDDRGEVAAGLQEIVSRAGCRGPGWALPGHPPAEGGWWIGPPPGRMLSPG